MPPPGSLDPCAACTSEMHPQHRLHAMPPVASISHHMATQRLLESESVLHNMHMPRIKLLLAGAARPSFLDDFLICLLWQMKLSACCPPAAIILGGGAGSRLYPLTKQRAKPAVPIGGAYRLIDVPMSNCINSGISKIYVLTQFNSTSLNRHLARTYNFGNGVKFGGDGFVEVLAATQTPKDKEWFQVTLTTEDPCDDPQRQLCGVRPRNSGHSRDKAA